MIHAWAMTQQPERSPQWTQRKTKEEPHGRCALELDSLQSIDNCKFYCIKLTQSYWGHFNTQMHVKHTSASCKLEHKRRTGHTCSRNWLRSILLLIAFTKLNFFGTKTLLEQRLPGVGLMGLLPQAARPRPRWWTSDSEL